MANQSQNRVPIRRYWPNGDVHSAAFLARYPDLRRLTEEARHAANSEIIFWHPWHMEKTWVHEKLESPINWGKVRTGDEEWPHALARLSHLVDLAAGWKLTGERPILDCYWDHVTQFCRARRETKCHLWPNRLDSALRIFHFIKSFDLLNQTNDSTEQQRQLLFGQIQFEVDFLLGGLGSKVGNWELIICCALLTAAEYLHGMVDTQIWRDRASARLEKLLKTEIQPDGHWIEQAPMYHGECIIALADYVTILKTNDLLVPDWLVKAMQTLLVTLEEITDPQGKIPQIGDSDAFKTVYIANLCEVLLSDSARPRTVIERESILAQVFPSNGWVVSKWNDSNSGRKYQLILDASGKPPKRRQWHSHADDLQVILTSSDGPILVDPGRFTYSTVLVPGTPRFRNAIRSSGLLRKLYCWLVPQNRELSGTDWRHYFTRTVSHNTVSCDWQDQSGYGRFENENPTVRLVSAVSDESNSTFMMRGEIAPDLNAANGYRHMRTVIGVLPNLVAVIDNLSADVPHAWVASWHLNAHARITKIDRSIEISESDDRPMLLSFHGSAGQISSRIDMDWISSEYNRKQEAKTIRGVHGKTTAARFVSLFRFAPLQQTFDSERLEVQVADRQGSQFDRIKLDSGDRSLIIWHQDEPKRFTDGEFTIDTELFVHRS